MSAEIGRIAVGLVSIFGFALSAFFFSSAVWFTIAPIPFHFSGSKPSDIVIFLIAGLASLLVTIQLIRRKRWAWISYLVISGIVLSGALFLFVEELHSRDDFEPGFGLFGSICILIPSALSMILLGLPSVRRRLTS